jgi:NitT/TauT family transport system permease protein
LKKSDRSLFFSVIFILILLGAWEASSRLQWIDPDLFPPVSRLFLRCLELAVDPLYLSRDVAGSLRRLTIATVVVVPFAIALGLSAGLWRIASLILSPLVNFTFPLPKVAIFPLILALFGLGDTGKIVLIGIGLFYPLFVNVMNGALRLKKSPLMNVVHVYRIRGEDLAWRFYIKGLIPDILTGLKSSLGYGFTLVIVSELTASNNGIGNFIWRAWDGYNILDMYAGIFTLCLLGWIVQTAFDRLLMRWLRLSA